MTHYAHILTVDRLQLAANLGFYTGERAKAQPIEVSFRLYFPTMPAYGSDDEAEFLDYGVVCKWLSDFVTDREFKLLEFLAMELFRQVRKGLDVGGHKDVKLWLRMNKVAAPVPGLTGGASYIHCDLPAGATVVPCDA